RAWTLRPRAGSGREGSRRRTHSSARLRARDDPRQRVWAAGTAYPSPGANGWGEKESVGALVVNPLDVDARVVGVAMAVGHAGSGGTGRRSRARAGWWGSAAGRAESGGGRGR